MEAVLKKYFWVVKFVGIALVVVFAASAAINFGLGRYLMKPSDQPVAVERKTADEEDEEDEDARARQQKMLEALNSGPTKSPAERAAESVVKGSIFCPMCAPEPIEEPTATSMAGPARPGEIKSRLPLVLLATMESDDPEYSMATILHTDTNLLAPYSPNDEIRAGVVVSRVDRGRVVFRNGMQMEYIELGAEPPPMATSAAVPKPKVPEENKNSREIEGADQAISCDSDFTSCTVDKKFVEKLLANPAQLTKQARIVPAVRDGETKGYKFYGIRPGSLPKLLGMKNGDLLTSVNGHQLESLDQAMELYTKLRRASHLSVTIERKGEVIQKEIDIK